MNWNPFRRSSRDPKPPFDLQPRKIPPQPEGERDWAVGDKAECIAAANGHWTSYHDGTEVSGPKRGQISRVIGVHAEVDGIYLWLDGWQRFGCYNAGHFRKLRPCSTDFREQLRQRAPAGAPGRAPQRLTPVPAIKEPELVP